MKRIALAALSTLAMTMAMAQAAKPAVTSPAAPVSAAPTEDIPPALMLPLQSGLKIENKFNAVDGVTGWVLSEGPGRNLVVYTPDGSDVVIAGQMIDSKGQNLTKEHTEKYAPKIDYSKYWDPLSKTGYVADVKKGVKPKSIIYAFKDANCIYCHRAFNELRPYVEKGVEVRWVMVAILGRDSANKAAALMGSTNKAEVLDTLHKEWGKTSSYSGTSVSPEVRAQLDKNSKLMQELGIDGTPAFVFKDETGKVDVMKGLPDAEGITKMTGVSL